MFGIFLWKQPPIAADFRKANSLLLLASAMFSLQRAFRDRSSLGIIEAHEIPNENLQLDKYYIIANVAQPTVDVAAVSRK